MNFKDFDERPAKKRRFFVDDEPAADETLSHKPALPHEATADADVAAKSSASHSQQNAHSLAFDADLFASFVGEKLSADTLKKLQEVSGNDIQRGRHNHSVPPP